MLFKVSAWCVWVSGCQFKSKCFCFQLRIYLIYFQLRPPEVLPQGWKVSWDGPAVSEFQFSQRRISRMQLTATNVWSQIWESKCHLGQILQRRVRCSWQGFKLKIDTFLLCSVVWKWLWPSLAVSKRWLLRVYPQGSDLQSFLDFTNPPLINLKSFPLPGGSQTWEVCDGQCLPLGGKCSTSCLKGSFAEIFIKMKTFASKVCASWGASACLWWRRAREWGKDELVAKAMAKWRVSIRWECDGKCTNISSLCEEGKIITDQICKRWG